jgi:hypothetical protein
MRYVVFEHDPDPDFSWLEQDHLKPGHPEYSPIYLTRTDMRAKRNPIDPTWYTNPDNHVALSMLVYETCGTCGEPRIVDSIGGIDFLADSDEWTIGRFNTITEIPKRCRYLRSLAREAKLGYARRGKR